MSKKKIFYALSVFLILGATMSVLNVRAHPPINIDLEYYLVDDPDYPELRETLSIRLTHGVTDPEVHYIYEIDVWINVTQIWEYHGHQYFNDSVPGKGENYAIAVRPLGTPNYTFTYTEQPTDTTPITISHTLPIYILPLPGLKKTGEFLVGAPINEETGLPVPYLDKGRTNITVDVKCNKLDWEGNTSSLIEHYYVGLPYYNPHLTFAEAAMPATVSTIVVFALLFILPKLGQKSAPKLKEGKIKY